MQNTENNSTWLDNNSRFYQMENELPHRIYSFNNENYTHHKENFLRDCFNKLTSEEYFLNHNEIVNLEDFFDDGFLLNNQDLVAEKLFKPVAANHKVEAIALNDDEVAELHQKYRERTLHAAQKIADIAKQSGASDDIDVDLIVQIIKLYQQKRENPKIDSLVNLAIAGNQALLGHQKELAKYSPFTPKDLRSVFDASAQRSLPSNVTRLFGNKDRIYYRLNIEDVNPTQNKIAAELENNGYKILSYEDGIAVKIDDPEQKQKYKIGKLLKDNQALLDLFKHDHFRQVGQYLIVVSKNPNDIARMSTDRAWVSCMSSKGMLGVNNFHYVPEEIKQGAIVAYVVKKSDPDIDDPLSRILLKPYELASTALSFKQKSWPTKLSTLYVPGPSYGLPNQLFSDAMVKIAEQLNQTLPNGTYHMAYGCYADNMGEEALLKNGNVKVGDPESNLHMFNILEEPHFILNEYHPTP